VQGHHGLQGMKLVLTMSTSPPAEDQLNFVRTSKFFSFYLDIDFGLKRIEVFSVQMNVYH
jgi:hypothetical protein